MAWEWDERVIEKLASQVTFLANFDLKMSNYVRDRFCDTAFLQYEMFACQILCFYILWFVQ